MMARLFSIVIINIILYIYILLLFYNMFETNSFKPIQHSSFGFETADFV